MCEPPVLHVWTEDQAIVVMISVKYWSRVASVKGKIARLMRSFRRRSGRWMVIVHKLRIRKRNLLDRVPVSDRFFFFALRVLLLLKV